MAHSTRPLIGINTDYLAAGKSQGAQARLSVGYFDGVVAGGGLPVLMPPFGKEAEIGAFLDLLDGFLLTGGLDLDPRRQGQPTHASIQPMAERRESSDRLLMKMLLQRQLPILAVGVGMHQLNQVCGGTTTLHIPEEYPRAMPHWDPSGHGPHRHAVQLQHGTRLDEIYGEGEILVNSHHHQSIKQVGAKFRVAALAPDGIIEAIEATEPGWYCVGVQWQPESETASALDLQLFESFIQACTRQESKPLSLAA